VTFQKRNRQEYKAEHAWRTRDYFSQPVLLELGSFEKCGLREGTTWRDTGTVDTLNAASSNLQIVEERQGNKISCLEDIAWRNKWISHRQLQILAHSYRGNDYGAYLLSLY
jgi:glucose-1-phosphate thymidylyltransferase